MSFPEDQLREALRADEPKALDADLIIRGARRQRARTLTRIGVTAAAAIVLAGVGVQILNQPGPQSSTTAGSAPAASTQRGAPESESADEAQPPAGPAPAPTQFSREREYLPGMTIRLEGDQWCVVAIDTGAGDCIPRAQFSQRVSDVTGAEWLLVLAHSGPRTSLIQVEQPAGWVNLRTSRIGEDTEFWVGVVPGAQAPDQPRAYRALDSSGVEVWHR